MKEDRFIKYLTQFTNSGGDINSIQRNTIVDFEGEPLKVGEFLHTIRNQHKLFTEGSTAKGCTSENAIARYGALDKMDLIWEPRAVKQQQLQKTDPALDYIVDYYDKHHTYEGLADEIIVDGKTYNIKNFINHMRINYRHYLKGENSHGSMSPTSIKRYKALNDRKFDWYPKPSTTEHDKPTLFLQEYYAKHKTLVGVPKKVEYNGEVISIESYLSDRRKERRRAAANPDYQPSKLEKARWVALDDMHYDWDYYEKQKQESLENDPFIRYLEWHFQKYGTINNISSKQEVEFEDKILKIGIFINDCRKKHLAYITKGVEAPSTKTPLCLKRYAALDKLNFDWRPSETAFSLAEHARKHDVRVQTLRKNLKRFNGDLEKTTKFSEIGRRYNIQVQQNKKAKTQSLSTIMSEFEVDLDNLTNILQKKALHTTTVKIKPKKPLTIDGKTKLYDYCITNGLNYTVIQKAIRLKQEGLCEEDLQSLINRVITEYNQTGQHSPSTWIYSKYGNEALVRHLLLSMHLDSETILRDMSKNCVSLEEAIENNCFVRNSTPQQKYLEPLYHDIVNFCRLIDHSQKYTKETAPTALAEYIYELTTEFNLDKEEYHAIFDSVSQYIEAIDTYRLYNVGFELDQTKKVNLIMQYQLDDDEIEEAFFMPLQFDKKVMIGRNSLLYERRKLLKDLTMSWGNLSLDEKELQVESHSLTGEEIKYITETRHNIDATKAKVHEKQLQNK